MLLALKCQKIGKKIIAIYAKTVGAFTLYCLMTIKEKGCHDIATPMVIANHVNSIDILYLTTRFNPLSVVAKESMSRVPVIGSIAKFLQCLFLSRESETARKDILEKIKHRMVEYEEKSDTNPLLIFPEGTTSNGRSILRFKNGAFSCLPRITIIGLIYDCEGFQQGMEEITPIEHMIISLCLKVTLTVKMETI